MYVDICSRLSNFNVLELCQQKNSYVTISRIGTAYWFAFLFVLAPLVGKFEIHKPILKVFINQWRSRNDRFRTSTLELFTKMYIKDVEAFAVKEIFPKFKLATVGLDWSPKRRSSRGGMYADGPGTIWL